MNKGYITAVTKYMIELFYQGDKFQRAEYYTKDMLCIAPEKQGRENERILHFYGRPYFNRSDTVLVTGSYYLCYKTQYGKEMKVRCQYSTLFQYINGVIKMTMLHISEELGKVFQLTDVIERTYFLQEAEVLYLESGHNRVFWHTAKEVVEVAGSLINTECRLPNSFVRIHRSFIVNSMHVEKIERCHVELSNGDQLQIPVKKYTDVKKKLIVIKGNT